MDLALFEQILAQLSPLTGQVTFHLMGDPLMHPKLAKMVELVHQYGLKIFLVTNGVLLKDPQIELLLHPAFHQINFSLHSFADNFPGRDSSEYMGRIFTYVDRALSERPELYLNFRLWNFSDPKSQSPDNQIILQQIEKRYGISAPTEIDVRKKKSFVIKGRLYFHFDTEFIWPALDLPVLGQRGTCHGLTAHFGVLVDGTVVPCCLDKEGSIPLGNVKDQSLRAILADPRAQKMIQGFRNRKLVEDLCQRCQYIERFSPTPNV